MYQIDFHKPMHIHFIGIGGISMSGLAEILLEEDFVISGSDAKESELTKLLEARGARFLSVRELQISPKTLNWWCIRLPFIQTIRNLSRPRPWGCPCLPEQNFWDR